MTVALNLETVITSIGNVTVTGLTICSTSTIPDNADQRLSYLIPSIGEPSFLTDFRLEDVTFGGNTAGKDAYYTLNYKLLYCPAGVGRGVSEVVPGLIGLAVDFIEAMEGLATLAGAVQWDVTIGDMIQVSDPSNVTWDGCMITVSVHEFAQ